LPSNSEILPDIYKLCAIVLYRVYTTNPYPLVGPESFKYPGAAFPLRRKNIGGSMLNMKRVSESYEMKVFTDAGDYFGDIEEVILTQSKITGWRVRATKNSFLNKVLGSAKGVIVPHQLVKSMGDIMIINKSAIPSYDPDDDR
jgi:sporulation protein YlmC with PRC-barrel domain